jgi:hypothetical protein
MKKISFLLSVTSFCLLTCSLHAVQNPSITIRVPDQLISEDTEVMLALGITPVGKTGVEWESLWMPVHEQGTATISDLGGRETTWQQSLNTLRDDKQYSISMIAVDVRKSWAANPVVCILEFEDLQVSTDVAKQPLVDVLNGTQIQVTLDKDNKPKCTWVSNPK